MNVLIVGAGPTGLTVALELARQGILADIVDAKDEPSWKSRAVALLPRSIEILDRTGVGQQLVAEGVPITSARIHRGNRCLLNIDMTKFLNKSKRLTALAQNRTEELMSAQLERMDVSVQYGKAVTSVANSENSVDVTFDGGERKTYDWVVGADGVNSTVRTSLGVAYTGYELEEEWSIADVELENECEGAINAWLLKGERGVRDAMVMIPIEKKRIRLISSTPDSLATVPIELDVKSVRRTGVFKIAVRQAEKYVLGNVLLAGDAAHAHSPVGGRGMNLGIEDAQAVASALVQGTVNEYEAERKTKARRVIKNTELARKIITSNNPFIVALIHVVTWCIQNIGFMQRKFVRNIVTL